MDTLVVKGVQPWDGRYDLDWSREFTTREWGWIKRLSGYLPLTLEGASYSDPELICALAVIVIYRAGKIEGGQVPELFERFQDTPFGSTITIETSPEHVEDEDDAGPPPSSSNGKPSIFGDSSTTSSETSAPIPPDSGIPDSGFSEYDQPTLVT